MFANDDVRSCWRENWEAKEKAIRSRMVLNCERLERGSREQSPLCVGDFVYIQNQGSSTRSTKWDREGVVVAVGKNDQYLVKVSGSGRLTLRNRRFLRKFERVQNEPPPVIPSRIHEPVTGSLVPEMPLSAGQQVRFQEPMPSEKPCTNYEPLQQPMLPPRTEVPGDASSPLGTTHADTPTSPPDTNASPSQAGGVREPRRSTRVSRPPDRLQYSSF